MELIKDEVPVGDHQANGLAENAVKSAQGQLRVMKDALETRLNRRIGEERRNGKE